jgi:NAD-dependent deacetylase
MMIDVNATAAQRLRRALDDVASGYVAVITGAGISLASGIPTFRGTDPDAVWAKDVTELGTLEYFVAEPVNSWRWYLDRFIHTLDKQPNAAHAALVQLERQHVANGGEFLLVTQNVDPLHERAGAQQYVKVHGSADRVRCVGRGCIHAAPAGSLDLSAAGVEQFLAAPSFASLPRCPECGELLRPHVLWFDEFYGEHEDFQWPRVLDCTRRADLCLFVGTSFAVGVTRMFVEAVLRRHVVALSIDPGVDETPHRHILALPEKAEVLLPDVVAMAANVP